MNAFFISAECFEKKWCGCMAADKCHSPAKSFSARGILPLARKSDFSQWRFAISPPKRFQPMAFCHLLPKTFSANGILPFARQSDFSQWHFAICSPN